MIQHQLNKITEEFSQHSNQSKTSHPQLSLCESSAELSIQPNLSKDEENQQRPSPPISRAHSDERSDIIQEFTIQVNPPQVQAQNRAIERERVKKIQR
jgi:hypothetical protein